MVQRYEKFSYPCTILLLILEINALYSVADACKHLVRYGVEDIRQHRYGKIVAENLYAISLVAINIRNVYHGYVHTDVAYILSLLPIDKTVAVTVAQMAVEPVGIAYRNGGNHRWLANCAPSAVADGIWWSDLSELENGGFQRADVVDDAVVARVHTIETKSQTAHVHLPLGEMLNAGGVVHVAEYLVLEGGLQAFAALVEECKLTCGEVVEVVAVCSYEVGEYRAGNDGVLVVQSLNELVNVSNGVKAKPVHACVELYVYGIARDAFLLGSLDKCVEYSEVVNLWLQIVVKHCLEGCHLRVHHHDVARNAVASEGCTLIGYCHGEIVYTMVLQCFGNLYAAGSVGIGFYHAYQLGLRL